MTVSHSELTVALATSVAFSLIVFCVFCAFVKSENASKAKVMMYFISLLVRLFVMGSSKSGASYGELYEDNGIW